MSTPTYTVEIVRDWQVAAPRWAELAQDHAVFPFQHTAWLTTWYATLGAQDHVTPLIVFVADADGKAVMQLALILNRTGHLRTIEFADLGVTDFNAPVIASTAPKTQEDACALWRNIQRTLPQADLLVMNKVPRMLEGQSNPLTLLPGTKASVAHASFLVIKGTVDEYYLTCPKKFRKEQGRIFRVFNGFGNGKFSIARTPEEAEHLFDGLETMQMQRLEKAGKHTFLDNPIYSNFYRTRLLQGLKNQTCLISALTLNGDVIAALYGVRQEKYYCMLRIAHAAGPWERCSPGRLIIDQTLRALREEGVEFFDFAIGDYRYKRSFGPKSRPLSDLTIGLGWRGLPSVAVDRAKTFIKKRPVLEKVGRTVLRR